MCAEYRVETDVVKPSDKKQMEKLFMKHYGAELSSTDVSDAFARVDGSKKFGSMTAIGAYNNNNKNNNEEEMVIGVLLIETLFSCTVQGKEVLLFKDNGVVVHPEWRRMGVASQMLQQAKEMVNSSGGRFVFDAENEAAAGLAEKAGFMPLTPIEAEIASCGMHAAQPGHTIWLWSADPESTRQQIAAVLREKEEERKHREEVIASRKQHCAANPSLWGEVRCIPSLEVTPHDLYEASVQASEGIVNTWGYRILFEWLRAALPVTENVLRSACYKLMPPSLGELVCISIGSSCITIDRNAKLLHQCHDLKAGKMQTSVVEFCNATLQEVVARLLLAPTSATSPRKRPLSPSTSRPAKKRAMA
jgi:hypothetical protein